MPVLKVYKNGEWVEVDGVSGHTHEISDITNFPSSLPANGGNADTLDGKHADEFATSSDVEMLNTKIDNVQQNGYDDTEIRNLISDHVNEIDGLLNNLQSDVDGKMPTVAEIIPAGSDLDNYITPGLYGQNSTDIAKGLLNNPMSNISTGILLEVTQISNLIFQFLYGVNGGNICLRRRTSQGVWGDWNITANQTTVDGKLNKTGDSMSGNITFKSGTGVHSVNANGVNCNLLELSASGNLLIGDQNLTGYICAYKNLYPSAASNNQLMLGDSTHMWKQLYLGDSITDGTNTATMQEIGYLNGVTSNIQTQLDGKAASSHGNHVSYSTTSPVMDGTASAGSASEVARSDHKHPTDTSRAAASDLTALQNLVGDTKVSTQISNAINSITHPVTSVNNKTGEVVLSASDIGAESAGAADTALASAKAYTDEKVSSSSMPYTYGTEDLTAGVSPLETGKLYFVYE